MRGGLRGRPRPGGAVREARPPRRAVRGPLTAAALVAVTACADRATDDGRATADGVAARSDATAFTGDSLRAVWMEGPSLPRPLANNAVASLAIDGRTLVFSFLGIGTTKRHDGIVRDAYELEPAAASWRSLPAVPGEEGRIAATAETVRGRVYLFGGYTVDRDGGEVSVGDVDVWDPALRRWSAAAPLPVPVDDAVSGVWRDSLVYLVSGWSQRDNVPSVQVYDPATDRWARATPIPGAPVLGHAGGVADDVIVYCDGVKVNPFRRPRFVISDSCWRGDIDPSDPTRIAWRELAAHPGAPKYRAAAGAVPGRGWVLFAGGSSNPYNFDGVGYDGVPSEPDGTIFAYDVREDRWIRGPMMPVPTMDHRGVVVTGDELWVVGGMTAGQRVTSRTSRLVFGKPAR